MKETNIETISINGVEYTKTSDIKQKAVNTEGLSYAIVRTQNAGVFAGYIKERKGDETIILNARRLWSWSGAASLSQLAVDGVSKPNECKFPCEVDTITVLQTIEIIPATEKARLSINSVKIWQA